MRDLCPRLFPGRTDCAVFLHIVRTDAEPIVSYLGYIGRPVPAYRCIVVRCGVLFLETWQPEENLRLERGACTGRQETRMMSRQCYLVSMLRIRISRVTRARARELMPLRFEIINVSLAADENNSKLRPCLI